MIFATPCQPPNGPVLPETEFGLDIDFECYYANSDFLQSPVQHFGIQFEFGSTDAQA